MKKYLPIQLAGVVALLVPMLFLPMLHHHPAHDHGHGEVEEHGRPAAVHADFFPEAAHGHGHPENHHPHDEDLGVSHDPTDHALFQVDLFSLHVGRPLQSSSVFKKHTVAIGQDLSGRLVFSHFQRGTPIQEDASSGQSTRFSPPSLRAPPYFA